MTLRLKYLTGGTATYPPATRFGPRRTRDFELVWIIQGSVIYQVDGRADLPLEDGSIVLCRPGTTDGFIWDPAHPTRHAYLHFDVASCPDWWPSVGDWPWSWHLPPDDVVRPLFRYILSSTDGWGSERQSREHVLPLVTSAAQTMLGALLVGPVDQQVEHGPALPGPVVQALTFMKQTLDDDTGHTLSLPDLADQTSVSAEHLCRLFRESLDTSPVQAVRLLRLDRAVGLLVRSDLTVAQVAERTGFASPFHFSRCFKQAYGQSPSAARKGYLHKGYTPTNKITDRLARQVSRRSEVSRSDMKSIKN